MLNNTETIIQYANLFSYGQAYIYQLNTFSTRNLRLIFLPQLRYIFWACNCAVDGCIRLTLGGNFAPVLGSLLVEWLCLFCLILCSSGTPLSLSWFLGITDLVFLYDFSFLPFAHIGWFPRYSSSANCPSCFFSTSHHASRGWNYLDKSCSWEVVLVSICQLDTV